MDRIPLSPHSRRPATAPAKTAAGRIPPLPAPSEHEIGSKARFDRSHGPVYPHAPPWRVHGWPKRQRTG